MKLEFKGPLSFVGDVQMVFSGDLEEISCVYLWTIEQQSGDYLIHYIGETNQLALRHREHLVNILGFSYGIFDARKLRNGICELLWPGLWRKKTPDGPKEALYAYRSLSDEVLAYLGSISIFYAEVDADRPGRKLIEGIIGWNLREVHPEHAILYPADNYVERPAENMRAELNITVPQVILGLDGSIRS